MDSVGRQDISYLSELTLDIYDVKGLIPAYDLRRSKVLVLP